MKRVEEALSKANGAGPSTPTGRRYIEDAIEALRDTDDDDVWD